jgi:3,4-dihydroxy 2-butanone 4-phosphate synthase/GTP cyclohydrolase II
MRSDKQSNLSAALKMIEAEGKGVLLFIQQKGKQVGLIEKLQSYENEPKGKSDKKDYGIGAQILLHFGVHKLRLISSSASATNPVINQYGLEVTEVVDFN